MNFNPMFQSSSPVPALATRHYEELKASGISDKYLTNFKTIDSLTELLSRLNRRNHGELVKVPGWGVQGIDPRTGLPCDEAFQFKSDNPRIKENGNPLKYESPVGLASTPLFLQNPSNASFWVEVFETPSRKIYIAEGAKKAAYLMTLGLAAISIPGVTNGQKQGHLHPLLKALATVGREVAIVFDGDWRQKDGVALAMDTLGRLFCASGSVVKIVDIPQGKEKGIDDYGFVKGDAAALKLLNNPLTFEAWRKPLAEKMTAKTTGTGLSSDEAFEEVDGLRAKNLSAPVVSRELQRIARRSGIQPRELRDYYVQIDVDQQKQEALEESKGDFERILKLKDAQIDVAEIFPSKLGALLLSAGRVYRLNPRRYLQALLPAIGACVGSRIRLIDIPGATLADSRYTSATFFCADIGPPSSGKTGANGLIMAPLDAMQSEDDEAFIKARKYLRKITTKALHASKDEKATLEAEIEQVELELEKLSRSRIFNSGTPEGFARTMAKQEPKAGSVFQCDEITRTMSLGKYQGSSSDTEDWFLEVWNGGSSARSVFSNQDNNLYMRGQTLNICGGTQPELAKKMFDSESDTNGKTSRWLLTRSEPEADSWMRPTGEKVSTFGELRSFYEYLEALPEQYLTMDAEAQDYYWGRSEAFKKNAMVQAVQNPAYCYYLGKCNQHLLRITNALHLHDCYYDRSKDIAVVTLDTIQRASQLLTFYIGQFRLIQSEYTPIELNLAGLQLSCYQYLQSKGESITAYKLSRSWQRKKIPSRDLEIALDQLVVLGHATKDGKEYTFVSKTEIEPEIEVEAVAEDEVFTFECVLEEFTEGTTVTLITDDPCFIEGTIGIVQGTPEGFPEMRDVVWSDHEGMVTESRHFIHQLVETPF